jgi:hypothetical protein
LFSTKSKEDKGSPLCFLYNWGLIGAPANFSERLCMECMICGEQVKDSSKSYFFCDNCFEKLPEMDREFWVNGEETLA